MYDQLPVKVRGAITPLLKPFIFRIMRIRSIASQLNLPVYQIQGKSRWGDGPLKTILIGEGRGMLPYLLERLYTEEPTKEKIDKVFIGKIKSQIDSDFTGADIILLGIDEIFSHYLS